VSEPSIGDVIARLDDLMAEVRRQGRAAVGAQAAAEACLSTLEQSLARDEESDEDALTDPPSVTEIDWLKALIPVADAIDRAVIQAIAIAREPPRPRWRIGLFAPAAEPRLTALVEGLLVLKSQMEGALGELGVSVDRSVGAPIDPHRQRIVEVRAPKPGERSGTVVEVVRPGYAVGATLVREAEVVAAREGRGGTGGRG
jgi:GrpE